MTWRVIVPPDIQQQFWALPGDARDALMDLIQRLRQDPEAATTPYGHEDDGPVRMRTAATGTIIAVVTINDTTGNVSLMQLTHIE